MPALPQTHQLRHLRRTIGENLRHARRKKEMSLKKLAQRTGIGTHKLDCFESGYHGIRLEDMVALSSVLDVEVRQLVESA